MTKNSATFKLLIHGGAGTILPQSMTPEIENQYREGLSESLVAGYDILKSGGSALLAVEAAVAVLEDNPLFNAGRGSVFNHQGQQEMDAAIMDGKNLKAGAIAGVKNIKNPVSLALRVMQYSNHVMLFGEGAQEFASQHGVKQMESSYFFTDFRYQQLLQILGTDQTALDHNLPGAKGIEDNRKFGTVGAVALDADGNLAAATSTGGLTNKRFGRVGDSSIIGAGTYANNATCAVSATGHGETFIRNVVAYDISCLMAYGGLSLETACEKVISRIHAEDPECGGVIALDAKGNFCFQFNTPGMYRGLVQENGKPETAIYR